MPPETSVIPLPSGRGRDAIPYLESVGLVDRIPAIRTSDYEALLSNPFHYYLCRRLGLLKRLSWSKALSRGSWVHKAFETDDFEQVVPQTVGYWAAWDQRLAELRASCNEMGIIGASQESIVLREEKDMKCSLAWYTAAAQVHLGDKYGTFRQFLRSTYWQILGREVRVTYNDPSFPKTPLVTVLDGLAYHKLHKTVWVIELKTCDEAPIVRAATNELEFQTQHITHIVSNLLRRELIQEKFLLPPETRFGGVMHIIIQKPTIELSSLDRDCRIEDFTPTRGPNKGVTRQEKIYFGEPRLENYISRCRNWYMGEEDYSHLAEQRKKKEVGPPVNISFSTDVLEEEGMTEYTNRLRLIYDYATRSAYPAAFVRSASSLRQFGSLHPLAPFSLTPVVDWPEVMAKEGFMISHRDQEGTFHDGFDAPHPLSE